MAFLPTMKAIILGEVYFLLFSAMVAINLGEVYFLFLWGDIDACCR